MDGKKLGLIVNCGSIELVIVWSMGSVAILDFTSRGLFSNPNFESSDNSKSWSDVKHLKGRLIELPHDDKLIFCYLYYFRCLASSVFWTSHICVSHACNMFCHSINLLLRIEFLREGTKCWSVFHSFNFKRLHFYAFAHTILYKVKEPGKRWWTYFECVHKHR